MSKLFEGIKVLDFSNNLAGPYCAGILADFGADVIKIERPVFGDDTRNFNPAVGGYGISSWWLNRGKKGVTIALDDPEGIEIIKKMIPDMDIIVENFRPGVMKKFGIDYDSVVKIKPDIIYCSISAFGQQGLYSTKPGYDLIAQALSGMMDLTGEPDGPPMKHGSVIGDYVGAINGFGSISAALYHRLRTGEGQQIDISLHDSLVAINGSVETSYITPEGISRMGNHHSILCPYGVFKGKNNQNIVICAPNEKLWGIFCGVIGRPELITDPVFATGPARCKNLDKVIEVIEDWLMNFDDLKEAADILDSSGVPCCRVLRTKDLFEDKQLLSRDMLVDFEIPDKDGGPSTMIKTKGVFLKMSKTPGKLGKAPMLGGYNNEVLSEYGLSQERIDELQARWEAKALKKRQK